MANERLIEEFDQCMSRLADGATIDDCVQLFPQHENELRVMLEATQIPRKAQVSSDEVRFSQARVRLQFERALTQSVTPSRQNNFPLQRVASILLLMLFVGSLLTTGVVVVAQDSLPGDNLYSVKRLTEQVQLSVSSDKDGLQEKFNQRRIDETKQVIKLKREVDVNFIGVIDEVSESFIHISGLSITVSEYIETIELMAGMRVEVFARTQLYQTLLASEVRILGLSDANNLLDERLTPTIQTITATPIRQIEASSTPTELSITRDPSATPYHTPSEDTSIERPTTEATLTRADRSAIASPTVSDDCNEQVPDGWIRYTIQSGDTPLGIAIGTDISLDQLYAVNCDLNPRLIVAGEAVYVPYKPRLAVTATPMQRPTDATTIDRIIATSQPTTETRDVRPSATPSRDEEKSSDKRVRDSKEDERKQNDGR
jgi:hypothetical protein